MDDEPYGDANRAFLQAFLARSTMTFEEAKPVLAAILTVLENKEVIPNDVTLHDLNGFISTANTAISAYDLEIRSTQHQTARTRTYALVNTTSDPLTQLATTYSPDEIAYLKRLLDAMFETNNTTRREIMALTSFEALKLAKGGGRRETQNGTQNGTQSSNQGITGIQAEAMLKNLVEEGWFERSRKGYYSLSPRALIELRGWLVSTYNDEDDEDDGQIKFCQACKEIITVGQRCSQLQCPCRLHDICTQNFFRAQQSSDCPRCKTVWDGKHYVGERAVTMDENAQHGRRRGAGSRHNDSIINGIDEGGGE